jgi:RNA polymerase sigma factor (sigma-70 family)
MAFNFGGVTKCDLFTELNAQTFKNIIVSLASDSIPEGAREIANDALECFYVFSQKICENIWRSWKFGEMEYKPDADDLQQDLLWNLQHNDWAGLKLFNGTAPRQLGAYVQTCSVRILTKYKEKEWSKTVSLDASSVPDNEDAPTLVEILPTKTVGKFLPTKTLNPEEKYINREHREALAKIRHQLQNLISLLSPREKAIFVRRFYKEMPSKEVAQELYPDPTKGLKERVNIVDVTYSNVKKKIGKILRKDAQFYKFIMETFQN